MRELIKAVEYNIKPILWYIGTILVCLLIGCAIGTFWLHVVLFPPMQVTPITDGEWHGITVRPAIVAASKVPQGVIAQIELTINIPAQHEWATLIESREYDHGNSKVNTTFAPQNGAEKGQKETMAFYRKYSFLAHGGGWFTSEGEIYHNPWSMNLTMQQLADGSYRFLTDEEGITFTVKNAVKVADKPKPSYTASVLYNGNWGGSIGYSPGWKMLGVTPIISAGYIDKPLVGLGIEIKP